MSPFAYCDTCGKYGLQWFRVQKNWWFLIETDTGRPHQCPDPILDDQYATTINPPHPCILCQTPVRRVSGYSVWKKEITYYAEKDSLKPHNCPINITKLSKFNSN